MSIIAEKKIFLISSLIVQVNMQSLVEIGFQKKFQVK